MPSVNEPPRIYPTFRYRDAAGMIDWLTEAFGFTLHARHMNGNEVVHAELAFGSSMIMLGSEKPDTFGKLVGRVGQAGGGKATYVAVDNADALYARATAAGAEIEEELTDRDYGSREFICRDPEGNLWCFGTYWPRADEPAQ